MPTLEEIKNYNASVGASSYLNNGQNLLTDPQNISGTVKLGFEQAAQEKGQQFVEEDLYGAINEEIENRRSRNQNVWEKTGIGLTRLAGKTLTKTAAGAGFVGGLLGIDNRSENYGEGLAAWIAGAADNGLSVLATDLEKDLEESLPLYNSLEDRAANKVSVFNNLLDADFWAGDAVDAGAFLASAYLTGMGVSSISSGAGLVRGLSAIGRPVANAAKVAKTTDWITATALQTASESMFEAKDVRDKLREDKALERYGVNFDTLNPEQQLEINREVAPAAAKTFATNMALLAGPNFLEMKSLMKNAGRLATAPKGLTSEGLQTIEKIPTGDISVFGKQIPTSKVPYLGATIKGFEKFAAGKTGSTLLEAAKGMAREGIFEENLQLAVSNFFENNPDSSLFDIDTYTGIFNEGINNFSTEEGKKSMLLGSIIGGLSGGRSGMIDYNRNKEAKKAAKEASILGRAALRFNNDVFEREDYTEEVDGKPVVKQRIKLDGNGNPVIDQTKANAVLADREHIEYLDDIATLAEENGNDVLAQLAKDASLAKWVKMHYDTGTENLLDNKIKYLENLSDEDFLKEGFDPSTKDQTIASMKNKVAQFTKLAARLDANLLTKDTSKEGAANFRKRKNELYNIGATLSSVQTEKNKLTAEKSQLESDPLASLDSQRRLAYLNLKISELEQVEEKFMNEYAKLSDINKGQTYYNKDYKKSITKKVKSFNPENTTVEQFTNFENSQLFGQELKMKGANIDAEFFEKGIEERLADGEEAPEILNDLLSENISVTDKTKQLLESQIDTKLDELGKIMEAADALTYGGDTSIFTPEQLATADRVLKGEEDINTVAETYSQAKDKINSLTIENKRNVNKKTVKESLLAPLTNQSSSAVFNASNTEEYVNLPQLEQVKKNLTNMIKVLKEKADSDYNGVIKEYEDLLAKTEELISVVKERLADKEKQQEKITISKSNQAKTSIGLNDKGVVIEEIYELAKSLIGKDIEKDLESLSPIERIGYINNVLYELKGLLSDEQKLFLLNEANKVTNEFVGVVTSLQSNTSLKELVSYINQVYPKNPKLAFAKIVQYLSKKGGTPIKKDFLKDFDFQKFKEYILAEKPDTRIPADKLERLIDLHEKVLGYLEFFDALNSEYNPVVETVNENQLSKDDKYIVPSAQQLFAIRDLLRFFLSTTARSGSEVMAYLKGYAGTGKTNIVLKWFFKLSKLNTDEVFATGHNEFSSKAINDSLETGKSPSLDELIVGLQSGTLSDKIKLLIVDEINAIEGIKVRKLIEEIDNYNARTGKKLKLVGLGDPNQITDNAARFGNTIIPLEDILDTYFGGYTVITPLTIRYRTNVSAVVDAQDLFIDQPKDLRKEEIYFTSNPENTLGANGSMASDAIEKELKTKNLSDGKTRAVIVHPDDVSEWKAKNLGVEVVSYVDVQGRTIDEVYVYINPNRIPGIMPFNQAMYTALSRATNYIFVQGLNIKHVNDPNVNALTSKNIEAIKEGRKKFQEDREAEMKQQDSNFVPTAQKPATPTTVIPTTPPPTDAPPNQPDPEDEDEEFFTEDEEIIPDPLEPEPQVEVVVEDGEVKLLYVKNKNIIGLRDADGNVLTEPITAGEKVVYIPTLSSQKYPIIGVYVERPDGYIEVGMLSEAELNDPPKGKEKIYAKLIEAKKGQLTKFNTDTNTGYLVPVGTPIVLAEGKVKQASKLTYTYSSVSQPFSWENILNKFKGFFTKTPTFDSSQAKIRIFTEKEITELKNQGFTGVIYAGAPYVLIENPTQEGTKKVAPQVIALKRKRLNANTHAEFLTPLMSFLEKYKQITKLFNDIGINEADDIADIISSSDVYLPTLIEKIKTKTGLEIKLTNDILTLRKEIDDLLHQPLTEKQKEVVVGVKVKNLVNPFIIDDKVVSGEVTKIDGSNVTVKLKNGNEVVQDITELETVTRRKPGKAQHIFNLIARSNNAVNGLTIRVSRTDKKGMKITYGKSLLPRYNNLSNEEFIAEFSKYSVDKQEKILKEFEEKYNRTVTNDDAELLKRLVYSSSLTPEDLDFIFETDSEGNLSTLQVPVPRESNDGTYGSGVINYTNAYINNSQIDEMFFEDSLESVSPASAVVTINNVKEQPIEEAPTGGKKLVKPSRRTKRLLKSVRRELGESLNKKEIVSYLKSIDKTLTDEEIKFVTSAQMMALNEGKESWGLYQNGIIYLLEDDFNKAYLNVARHELFHRIFDMMLNDSQKRLVYQKAIEEFGLDPNTDLESLEERIAEEYQEWRNKKPLSNFFNILFTRIRKWLGMSVNLIPDINTFFNNIDSGLFNEIVSLSDRKMSYAEIIEDFGSVTAFREAETIILGTFDDLKKEYSNINSSDTVPEDDNTLLRLTYESILAEYEELKDQKIDDVVYVQAIKSLSNSKVFNKLSLDMFNGLTFKTEAKPKDNEANQNTEDIIGSDWTDDIKDSEEINHEQKLSQQVKQFLSMIFTSDQAQVNPRFAYLVTLETFSGLDTSSWENISKSLTERFNYFKRVYSNNKDVSVIEKYIEEVVDQAYSDSIQDQVKSTDASFTTKNIYVFPENKKGIRRNEGESNWNYFNRISKTTGKSLKQISADFISYQNRNLFTELNAQASSLYRQNVHFGYYTGKRNNPNQSLRNAIVDVEVTTYINNILDNLVVNARNKVDGKNSIIWALGKIKQAKSLTKAADQTKRNNAFIEITNKLLGYEIKVPDGAQIKDFDALEEIFKQYQKAENDNLQPNEIINNIFETQRSRLNNLASYLIKPAGELRPSNYRRIDNKIAYVFTLSSQAVNTLQSFVEKSFVKKPEFLNSPYFKNNIFMKGLNTIHNYINYDGVTGEYTEEGTRYKNETESDWFARNFHYFFIAHNSDNKGKKYVQQVVTISNKPNIMGAEIDFLDESKIKQAILDIIKQENEFVKTFENSKVKYNTDNNAFGKLVERKKGISDSEYAQQVFDKMMERGEELAPTVLELPIDKIKLNEVIKYHVPESKITKAIEVELDKLNETQEDKSTELTVDQQLDVSTKLLSSLYYANFYINLHQLNQLMAGPEQFYKNEFDVIKRMSIAFATGYKGLVTNIKNFGLPKTYKSLVVKDVKGILGDDFIAFSKVWGKDFDLTDAQGFMTPKRAKELREGFGEAFNFGSVIKPVHFEIDENGIPRAVKYSCIELSDELVSMFPKLKQVRDILVANEIDEMVFESAVKVGKPKTIVEPNEDGTLPAIINPESILTLQNENYRIQSNPEHDVQDEEVAFPTQLGYFFNFSLKNNELANELFDAMSSLINNGLYDTLVSFGMSSRFDEKSPQIVELQRQNVRSRIANSMSKERDSRQIQFILNRNLGINTPFLVKKAITNMASIFSKATVGIRIPGGGLVLQSAYGTAEFTDKDGNLVKRDLKWRDADGFAEVILPDFWKDQFKVGDKILFDTQLGFRIPATELHSAVPIKVVGFYPNNKNVIIAPKEIVFFHGSDYDVDKLYVMRRGLYDKDVVDSEGNVMYKANTPVGYKGTNIDPNFIKKIESERSNLRAQVNNATRAQLERRLDQLNDLRELYYKNVIVESFIKVTTSKVNEDLMMSPISMDRFKGMGIEDESAFDLVARLKGFNEPKPEYKNYTTLKLYQNAVKEWEEKRNAIIFSKRNLYDLNDQMLMHKDNFSGTKLTGVYANMAKVIAYYFQSTVDGKNPKLKENYHITLNGETYDDFNYREKGKEITVNYDKEGKPVKNQPLITETIDSLVNAAIDNVKEQILPIIGFTNNLGGAAVSMVAMGIPLKDVVRTMIQPVSQYISSSKSFNKGYYNFLDEIKSRLQLVTKEDFDDLMEQVEKIEITSEKLEEATKKDLFADKDQMMFQLAVAKQLIFKAESINSSITKGVTAYSILKSMPIDYPTVKAVVDEIDTISYNYDAKDKEAKTTPQMVFENVDPVKLPHIKAAFKVLLTLKTKTEYLFFQYNPVIQEFAKNLFASYEVPISSDATVKMANLRTKKTYQDESLVGESLMNYFLTGLKYKTKEGYIIDNDVNNEEEYTKEYTKEDGTITYTTYTGMDAFLNRFSDEVRKLKQMYPENAFLKKLYWNNKTREWRFDVAKNMDQTDMITYELAFKELSDLPDNKFTKLQYEFIKYAVIKSGLRFGVTNYSLIIPSEMYEPLMLEFNRYMNGLSVNPVMYKDMLKRLEENFLLQFAINNMDNVKFLKKDEFEKDEATGVIRIPNKENVEVSYFVKVFDTLYYIDKASLTSEQLRYNRIIDTKDKKGYAFSPNILVGYYKIDKAFEKGVPIVSVKNVNNDTFLDTRQFNVGQKVRMVNFADYTRINMVEAEISDAQVDKSGKTLYTVTNKVEVNTVQTDQEILDSKEFQDLLAEGYIPEAALHKIKNKC